MFEDFQPLNKPLAEGVILPSVSIEPRFYEKLGVSPNISDFNFLRKLCWEGVKEKGIDKLDNAQEYYDRIKYELSTFEELGFCPYILLNWKILNFCDEQGIVTGKGRGSCVGSAVLYMLKVTHVDPIPNKLYFERFVSKNRAKKIAGSDGKTYLDGSLLPDCDHDIEFQSREKVIKFINDEFAGQTSKILTLNTLSGKACMRECLKIVDGTTEDEANHVSATIPKKFGKVLDFEKAIEESPAFEKYAKQYPKSYRVACKLEGLVKNTGVHPSGLAICAQKIDDMMPLQSTKDGEIISGFEMGDVGSLMVKFDILGLRTLSVIERTAKMVGINFKDFEIPKEKTYIHLQNLLAPQGIFQIETDVGFKVCQKVQPKNLDELSDVLSLSRPGSLSFVDEYVKVKNHLKDSEKRWPSLDKILDETKGTILFQETIMRVCHEVFGLSLLDAESVRRATGKKKKEEMEVWKPVIFDNAKAKGIPEEVAKFFWDAMIASADYSFNRCLSPETIINCPDGFKILKQIKIGDVVKSFDFKTLTNKDVMVKDVIESERDLVQVEFSDKRTIVCSIDHKFMIKSGEMKSVKEILENDYEVISSDDDEVFREIEGYEKKYKISTKGRVRSTVGHGLNDKNSKNYGGKFRVPAKDSDGYCIVTLCDGKENSRTVKMHRLIAKAWIENPNNLPEVNHLNGIRDDNRIENLEWTTTEENIRHSRKLGLPRKKIPFSSICRGEKQGSSKLKNDDVLLIRKLRKENGISYPKLGEMFGVSAFAVWSICSRKSWKHI